MKRLIGVLLALAWAGTAATAQAPDSHRAPDWLQKHGAQVKAGNPSCAVCHAQESCYQCHRGNPEVADSFPTAASGKAMNVTVRRHPPSNHTPQWATSHGNIASARPEACAGCHIRADCLECHRPNPAGTASFHPPGFLASHPQQAYTRDVSCATCHNTQSFCQTCHLQAGLTSNAPISRGYHDRATRFLGGHGPAARQSLESCVTCHVENDCLACHRQFNPHGPGFNPGKLEKRAEEMCRTCHGSTIPQASRRNP
jgi:predicted CXXCH cytochrome family protein